MITALEQAEHGPAEGAAIATVGPIRVLVVDDHPAVRAGVRELLEDQPDFRMIDVVSTAAEALAAAGDRQVDVAVVDYQLDRRTGLWVSRKLKRLAHAPRVLIYSAYSDGLLAAAAVVAEADGLVSKGGLGSDLCDAIREVARGHSLLPVVPWQLAAMLRRRMDESELAMFGMLSARIAPVDIAETLGLSWAELESRLWKMLRKLEDLNHDPQPRRATPAFV